MDLTSRIMNAWRQTEDESLFRSALIRIMSDDILPEYRAQGERLASTEAERDRLAEEVKRLRKLCASRPKLPDMLGMIDVERDAVIAEHGLEYQKWKDAIDAAGKAVSI